VVVNGKSQRSDNSHRQQESHLILAGPPRKFLSNHRDPCENLILECLPIRKIYTASLPMFPFVRKAARQLKLAIFALTV
jgi:hypothetical protein